MKRTILTTAAICAAVLVLNVPAAMAIDYEWVGGDGGGATDWTNANNWTDPGSLGGYPDDNTDTAAIGDVDNDPIVDASVRVGGVTIENGGSLTVSNPLEVNTITIETGGTLTGASSLTVDCLLDMGASVSVSTVTLAAFATGYTGANTLAVSALTVCSGAKLYVNDGSGEVALSCGSSPVIDGELYLSESGSELSFSSSCAISGSGSVVGENANALIEIANGLTLTLNSNATIEGALKIDDASAGSATFTNNGTVRADGGGTLTIDPNTLGGSGAWIVGTGGSDKLLITDGSTTLTGDFTVGGGTLDIDDDVTTSGQLYFNGGQIEVAAGVTFQAS